MKRTALLMLMAGAGLLACSADDFTPYKEIDRLRVLAVAADRPWLRPSETTTVSALVVQARDDEAPITYDWSWCPLTKGAEDGYECALRREDLQQQIDMTVGPGLIEVPSFDLGSTSSVAFGFDLPAAFFEGACDALRSQDIPGDFVSLPDCDGTFPITVRLEIADDDESVTAIKEIVLVYDDAINDVNRNPLIRDVRFFRTSDTETPIDPDDDGLVVLDRDVAHTIRLAIDEEQAEAFEGDEGTVQENLVASWFIDRDAGDLERTRTSYFEGEIPFSNLVENEWRTPKAVDFEPDTVRLFIVLRDGRRGISWTSRRVELAAE